METKKNDKAILENYSRLFTQLGLLLSLLIVYLSLEHKVYQRNINELLNTFDMEEIVEDIPITERIELVNPPPP